MNSDWEEIQELEELSGSCEQAADNLRRRAKSATTPEERVDLLERAREYSQKAAHYRAQNGPQLVDPRYSSHQTNRVPRL